MELSMKKFKHSKKQDRKCQFHNDKTSLRIDESESTNISIELSPIKIHKNKNTFLKIFKWLAELMKLIMNLLLVWKK